MSAIHLSIHLNRQRDGWIDERFSYLKNLRFLPQTYLVINLNYIFDESVDTHHEEF